jgi:hypothetical protein
MERMLTRTAANLQYLGFRRKDRTQRRKNRRLIVFRSLGVALQGDDLI